MTLRSTLTIGAIATGIALATLTAPAASANPQPSPCVDGGTSCLNDSPRPAPPEGTTEEQITLICYGTMLYNAEKGTNLPIPAWCPNA